MHGNPIGWHLIVLLELKMEDSVNYQLEVCQQVLVREGRCSRIVIMVFTMIIPAFTIHDTHVHDE
jgi:hypothetical protein